MYYLLYGFLYLVSLLPFWIIYLISDLAYVLIYYVIGYRKDIVMSNLSIAFPEKSVEEKKVIAKKFYKNFTDNFIETVKLFSISKRQLQKRLVGNFEMVNDCYPSGKNVQFFLGHFFNWEYANLSLSLNSAYPELVVYMPLKNKAMNKIFYDLRSRFNAKMIAATNYLREFKPYSKQRFAIVFVSDQNAGETRTAYWLPFFNKLAPFVTGPEKSARLTNTINFYTQFKKIKRGYYEVKFYELNTTSENLKEGELTKRMIKLLEKNIREQPEIYLWTHRRWKHEYDALKHRAL
ncbi:MAG: lysophospholipid acyltransferase family protein [Parafilimonas sp.]